MIVTKFGDVYASAYALPLLKGDQPFETEFRPITAQVSGAGGEFDFYGADVFPIEPKKIDIKANLTATTYAGITTQIDNLRAALVAVGRSKLWFEMRDSASAVPIRWAYAKCISVKEDGEVAGKNYTDFPIKLTFLLSEGLLYGATQQTYGVATQYHRQIVNRGTYFYSPINLSALFGNTPVIYVRGRRVEGRLIPAPTPYWNWKVTGSTLRWWSQTYDGPAGGSTLAILSSALSVKAGAVNYYADTAGMALIALQTGQVAWLTTDINLYSGVTAGQGEYLEVSHIGGGNISAVANTTPIAVTTTQNHGLASNAVVVISGTGGVCDGAFIVTVTGLNTYTLNGSAAAGTASAGRWMVGGNITAITVAAPPVITTSVNHGLSNGAMVLITGAPVSGDYSCNGVWKISNVAANTFELFEEVTGSSHPAFNPSAYGGSGANYYPTAGATVTASWWEAFV